MCGGGTLQEQEPGGTEGSNEKGQGVLSWMIEIGWGQAGGGMNGFRCITLSDNRKSRDLFILDWL